MSSLLIPPAPKKWTGASPHPRGGGMVSENARVDKRAYVGPNAIVYGCAVVAGGARIEDTARVGDEAHIGDKARIRGDAIVEGSAHVYDHAIVEGKAEVCDTARVHGRARLDGGCKVGGTAIVGGKAKITGRANLNTGITLAGRVDGAVKIAAEMGHLADPDLVRPSLPKMIVRPQPRRLSF